MVVDRARQIQRRALDHQSFAFSGGQRKPVEPRIGPHADALAKDNMIRLHVTIAPLPVLSGQGRMHKGLVAEDAGYRKMLTQRGQQQRQLNVGGLLI